MSFAFLSTRGRAQRAGQGLGAPPRERQPLSHLVRDALRRLPRVVANVLDGLVFAIGVPRVDTAAEILARLDFLALFLDRFQPGIKHGRRRVILEFLAASRYVRPELA